MPAVPSCTLDPIRDQFLALLPVREDRHPLGCHNPRISDTVDFGCLVQVPLITEPAPANTRDHTLPAATLDRFTALESTLGPLPEHIHLAVDAGYDYRKVNDGLAVRRIDAHTDAHIAARGAKTPIQTGRLWVVERTNSWMNNFGKLRRCTERRRAVVDFFLALASTIITVR
ncbi:hypothetical protein [Streptomyces sp. WM4235]|uniref:hypothetical protein n=1 Tax=Streptomyces sp. WM4235 TaxID=1415551 RepID=UPI00099CD9A5|nr:hypothetical protein [Streptomyces sp. WM4235]